MVFGLCEFELRECQCVCFQVNFLLSSIRRVTFLLINCYHGTFFKIFVPLLSLLLILLLPSVSMRLQKKRKKSSLSLTFSLALDNFCVFLTTTKIKYMKTTDSCVCFLIFLSFRCLPFFHSFLPSRIALVTPFFAFFWFSFTHLLQFQISLFLSSQLNLGNSILERIFL